MIMKYSSRTLSSIILLITITFGAGYIAGTQNTQTAVIAQEGPDEREELFRPFWETWDLLHQVYVDPLDDTALMEAALNGMVNSLNDPHMGYIPPSDYQVVLDSLNGEFEGIGATVRKDEDSGALVIVRPLPDSPAEAAGILAGDIVFTVDGEDITALDQEVIISMVRGPAGTQVVLGVQHPGVEDIVEITITRARITLPSVDYEVFDNNIGYLQIYQFAPGSDNEVHQALLDMDVESLNGLIIDLRGNTGGYVDATLDIMDQFIDEGVLLIERGGVEGERVYEASGTALAPTVPLVVLVDNGSASASELMAGALQDRGRATIIGVPTFGKGSVQTWRRLSNNGGIRITIARWYTPAGYYVEPNGIQPDKVVEFPPLEPGETYSYEIDPQLQAAIESLISITSPRV
jgi:carboxyl-terminal processing protease